MNPITALTDLLGKLVIEHGSAVITEKNLAYLRDQLVAAEKEINRLTSDNENLKIKVANLADENEQLKKKINDFHKTPPKKEYVCPRCHEPAFKLIKQLPHPNKFFANSGSTVRLYRCEKCNYEETI